MQLGTRSLTLNLGGFERAAEVSECRITSTVLARVLGGPPICEYRLQATAVQDTTAGSLWDLMWEHVGTEVDVEIRPAGGDSPSEEQPVFEGRVYVTEPEGEVLGGAANKSASTRFTFAIDWRFTGRPVRVTS